MKQLLCTLFFTLLLSCTLAQKNEVFTVSLDLTESPQKTPLPFSAIIIIDARFDKSSIGCVVKDLSFKGMTRNKLTAVFPDSLQTYLPRLLGKVATLNKESTDTVVMMIKQFRIADHLENTLDEYHAPETVITVSASFYKKSSGHLLKISSVNDTWSKKWEAMKTEGSKEIVERRNDAILALFSGIFQNKDWTPTQTTFSWSDMENGIQKRFHLPVYSDPYMKVGVYKTFEEFKHNTPTFTSIHLGMKNDELVQVLDENNNPVNINDFWGACDGKNRYVVFRGSLNKLLPSDKSFCFFSYRKEAKNRRMLATNVTKFLVFGQPMGNTNGYKARIREKQELLYLNMDTGHVYLEELTGTEPYEKAIKSLDKDFY